MPKGTSKMNFSGIQMIIYEYNKNPELKKIKNFSYFHNTNPFNLKKRPPPIITDLNQNASPFSPDKFSSNNSSCKSITFTSNIIENLLKGSSSFFEFDENEELECIEELKCIE